MDPAKVTKNRRCIGFATGVILLLLGPAAGADDLIFDLEEVSACELFEQIPTFALGQQATCTRRPDPNVRAYPALKSDKPVYGSVQFGSYDEARNPALLYHFVADESGGSGTGYDRLYLDLNGDKDLSNDTPVLPKNDWPAQLRLRYTSIERDVLFDRLGIPLPFGPAGRRPLEVVPRLLLLKGGSAMLSFVPTKARRGHIEIAGRQYDVFLGQTQPVCGWFDHPETSFHLVPRTGSSVQSTSTTMTTLMWMRRLGETFYRFAATPAGDKLFVRPYDGPLGDFEIGGPKFQTTALTAGGHLQSRDTIIPVNGPKCRLPVGDYSLAYLTVAHQGLTFAIQQNIHGDGAFRGKLYHQPAYPIPIREGTCFVLDFSHSPQIVFACPSRDHRARVGENLFVEAVLADPALDFVVCNLSYTPPQPAAGPAEPPAHTRAQTRNTTLPPQVTISRANGEVVARGVMGYG